MIEAANRNYRSPTRNAKLMALMEQVAQIDEEVQAARLRAPEAFIDRNARAIARLQERGLADPESIRSSPRTR